MFRHVVMFRWSSDATDDAKAKVAAGLATMPSEIDAIRHYKFGPDAGLADGNWDFAVVADFADVDGYITYRDHEAHQALIVQHIRPIVAERAAMQLNLPD